MASEAFFTYPARALIDSTLLTIAELRGCQAGYRNARKPGALRIPGEGVSDDQLHQSPTIAIVAPAADTPTNQGPARWTQARA